MKAVFVALFAGMVGCAFALPAPAANAATFQEQVLHSFCSDVSANGGCRDGSTPAANLIEIKGKLFGTTEAGGNHKGSDRQGEGTVFSLDPGTGTEKVLRIFGRHNAADGQSPIAGLIKVNGELFGTTVTGGYAGCYIDEYCGTVFSLDLATHAESVLYAFCTRQNCTDGENPSSSLIDVKGILYGTTTSGGSSGAGTVFSLDPGTGAETVIYSFCSQQNCADGAYPGGSLIDVNGMLYGTTPYGGLPGCSFGCGTVFSLDPGTGAETVLYDFCSQQNCADGEEPEAGLVDVNGTLYGTAELGGAKDGGTAFSLDPGTGTMTVVYSFCSQQDCADGEYPEAGLVNVNGILYGTTYRGGGSTACDGASCGTVFSLDPQTGVENVAYAFCSQQNCADGSVPRASLIYVNGVFYGTTESGGTGAHCGYSGQEGCGTVFAITTGGRARR